MGTTPNLGITYPDASDPFALGNEQMQTIAEFLDDWLGHHAKLARLSNQTAVDGNPEVVEWVAGDSELTTDFDLTTTTNPDDTLTYLGPDRFVVWRYGIKWVGGLSSGNASALFRRVASATPGSDDYVVRQQQFADLNSASPTTDSGLVFMETGSEWQLIGTQTTGADRTFTAWMSFKAV